MFGQRRDQHTQPRHGCADETEAGLRQVDQAVVRAAEGQEQANHAIDQYAAEDDKERDRGAQNPDAGIDDILPAIGGVCVRADGRRLAHPECQPQNDDRADQVQGNRKTQRNPLIDPQVAAQSRQDAVHQMRVIHRGAHEHGQTQAQRLPVHDLGHHVGPLLLTRFRRERLVGQRLVRAARQRLGKAAEHSVRQAEQQQDKPTVDRCREE